MASSVKEQSTLIRNDVLWVQELCSICGIGRLSDNTLVNSEQFIFTCSEAYSRRAGHGAGITGEGTTTKFCAAWIVIQLLLLQERFKNLIKLEIKVD